MVRQCNEARKNAIESSLSVRHQTTVPGIVRRALKLNAGDRIRYRVVAPGVVLMERAESDDIELAAFLSLLAGYAETQWPFEPVDPLLIERAKRLIAGVNLKLDAPLAPEDE